MTESALDDHSMVPVEEMCHANPGPTSLGVEDGITEEMDRVLADRKAKRKVQSWDEIWRLIFPDDPVVPDAEFQSVVEMVEVEQGFEESQDELKADLHESLRMFLPQEMTSDVCFFIAGQVQLVFEQHRAKVTRKCRNNASGGKTDRPLSVRSSKKGHRLTMRFSAAKNQLALQETPAAAVSAPMSLREIAPKHNSSLSRSSFAEQALFQPSVQLRSSMMIESPRLPFRDWVHGVKFNNGNEANPRDSGLALPCEGCGLDVCQCLNGDEFSAFTNEEACFQAGTDIPMDQYSSTRNAGTEYGAQFAVQGDGMETEWLG